VKNRGIDINLIKKMTRPKVASAPKLGKSFKTIKCSQPTCSREVVVDSHAEAVICHICVAKMVGYDAVPTVSKKYTSEERKARKTAVTKKKAQNIAIISRVKILVFIKPPPLEIGDIISTTRHNIQ
jgi:ribosomal protein S27E